MPKPTSRRLVLLLAALAGGVGAGLLGSRATRFRITEESMAPVLLPGDYVLAVRMRRIPVRGDVAVFEHPGRPGFTMVKRVVGLPGETVRINDGGVRVDGEPLLDPRARGATRPEGEWALGPDEVFLLGDQRWRSGEDGRTLGPLSPESLDWRVVARYWPPGRIGRVR